jgi:hypothetical protein
MHTWYLPYHPTFQQTRHRYFTRPTAVNRFVLPLGKPVPYIASHRISTTRPLPARHDQRLLPRLQLTPV